ncbi:MAG: hypothetical protein R2788_08390 [Saprospiraceae bacterium]
MKPLLNNTSHPILTDKRCTHEGILLDNYNSDGNLLADVLLGSDFLI